MTPQEVGEVMAVMMATWPNWEIPAPTQQLWVTLLSEVDPRDGEKTAAAVIRECEFPPAPAAFLQRAKQFSRTRHNTRPLPELSERPAAVDGKAEIAKLREQLARTTKGKTA